MPFLAPNPCDVERHVTRLLGILRNRFALGNAFAPTFLDFIALITFMAFRKDAGSTTIIVRAMSKKGIHVPRPTGSNTMRYA